MKEEHLDNFTAMIILKSFLDSFIEEWEKMRDLAADNPKSSKIIKYFNNLFANGFQQYILSKGTELYRARIIKNRDWGKIGVQKKHIYDTFGSIFLSKQEIEKAQETEPKMSLENLLFIKWYQQGNITAAQQKKLEVLFNKYSKPDFYGFSASGCGVPPKECRNDSRLSKRTNAYLYLSLERETVIQEMRPIIGQLYNIGIGIANRDLRLANLKDEELYNKNERYKISSILKKISEPNTDEDKKFYNITQILARIIKKQGFDGIIYKSSLKEDGANILLFSPKAIKFTSSEVVSINNIDITYTQIFPNKSEDILVFNSSVDTALTGSV